jgi:hypothetical protein
MTSYTLIGGYLQFLNNAFILLYSTNYTYVNKQHTRCKFPLKYSTVPLQERMQLQVFLYPEKELKFRKRDLNDLTFTYDKEHRQRKKYMSAKGVGERDITIELLQNKHMLNKFCFLHTHSSS